MYSEIKAYMCLMCFIHVSVVVCVMFLVDAAVVLGSLVVFANTTTTELVLRPSCQPTSRLAFHDDNF